MNKNLKFRAWDGKRFHYWGYKELSTGEVIFVLPPVTNYPNQQFVTNQNCVDLYMGDIIKSSNQTLHYLMPSDVQGCACVIVPCRGNNYGYSGRSIRFLKEEFHNFQVVGNIFENPELIEEMK